MPSKSVAAAAARLALRPAKVLLLVCAIAGTACGQKGPLTLPAPPAAASAAASGASR